ncbi:unnamed protein product [Rotaria sp. Silwood2]|nr:unnamed protein product [Rotaria sp. Silwood2]CAF2755306.1 unnamed protein product [Rotaria sp. Silwood2]CAF3171102.1 unnamed protein product [Rotaria sp. Silwood2]CAF3292469.1 unnamed protein product [Rotaria sp. Silwood2]CAF4057391.1 unnamed protein product [Rotaria sp. Silwood2]
MDIANTSDVIVDCTFESRLYKGTRDGYSFNIYDTTGLNESDKGRVKPDQPVGNLMKLIRYLEEGIHLLIICMRKGIINNTIANNYHLFYDGIFGPHVQMILVVAHCELDDPIVSWKTNNQSLLKSKFTMEFNDIICVTALNKGKHAVKWKSNNEIASSR